jgi:NAD/NADP transhydrogenase alpha subunit
MKKNAYVNKSDWLEDFTKKNEDVTDQTVFMRKGKAGGYKEEMSEEYIKKFDEWIQEKLKGREHRFYLV